MKFLAGLLSSVVKFILTQLESLVLDQSALIKLALTMAQSQQHQN